MDNKIVERIKLSVPSFSRSPTLLNKNDPGVKNSRIRRASVPVQRMSTLREDNDVINIMPRRDIEPIFCKYKCANNQL